MDWDPNDSDEPRYLRLLGTLIHKEQPNRMCNYQSTNESHPEDPSNESPKSIIPEHTLTPSYLPNHLEGEVRAQSPQCRSKQEERAPNYRRVLSHMKDMNTSLFLGGAKPLEADEWIKQLKRNFNLTRCPLEFKMDVAVHFLEGNAFFWWKEVERGRNVNTWIEFENEFRMQYLPPEARDGIELQFIKLEQGSRSVREYESEFRRLLCFLQEDYDKEQADIRRFTRGLRPDIQTCLAVREFNRLVDLVEKAILVDECIQEEKTTRAATFTFGSKASLPSCPHHEGTSRKNKGRFGQKKNRQSAKVCYNCGNDGHIARNCKNDGHIVGRIVPDVTCFRCGGKGHYATSCPEPHKLPPPSDRPVSMPPPKRQALNAMDAPVSSSGNKDPNTG
ncbi:Retrotransposon gag domain [Arabidopsis thaliana x Arabidopsis arenosa]|uniref:Retrotransposon gag domain n=1 Tax=Arabidopsis thaliana x Arabidopsis arenosa TaxID=1240361 RepID=A0A8T1YE13_9BRAS|nr:Retrotransposon gag domain [Arabidopsis thaliana x Arabidopsis arenosa]